MSYACAPIFAAKTTICTASACRLAAMRSLFLGYIGQADRLLDTPRFYNTLTVNCTMLVYHMMKRIVGYLPWSYRLLFTGYLPAYVYGVGGLDQRFTLQELRALGRITDRARQSDRSESFSADIRKGIPVLDPADLPAGRLMQRRESVMAKGQIPGGTANIG